MVTFTDICDFSSRTAKVKVGPDQLKALPQGFEDGKSERGNSPVKSWSGITMPFPPLATNGKTEITPGKTLLPLQSPLEFAANPKPFSLFPLHVLLVRESLTRDLYLIGEVEQLLDVPGRDSPPKSCENWGSGGAAAGRLRF